MNIKCWHRNLKVGFTFVIDSKDTKWLKIVSDGESAYPTHSAVGSLKIVSEMVCR